MRSLPNFALLRAFEAAARLNSFTAAARELHLTPSAISHQVKALAQYFSRPLFLRAGNRVSLTDEGRRLFQSLARVMDALEASCQEVSLPPSEQVLTLHCAPSFAAKWLGPRLPLFARNHPEITIRLTSSAVPLDLDAVREVDVAISYGYALERAGIEVLPLGRERIAPMCAPAALRSVRSPATALLTLPLIDSGLSQVTWRDWFTENKLTLPSRPRPSFDRAALAIAAAVDGMGIILESTRLAERELLRGELKCVGEDVFSQVERETHFLSQRSNEGRSRKISTFRTWLMSLLEQAPGVAPQPTPRRSRRTSPRA